MTEADKAAGWEFRFSNVTAADQGQKRIAVAVSDLCEALDLARTALRLKGSHPADQREPLTEADLKRLSLGPKELKVDG